MPLPGRLLLSVVFGTIIRENEINYRATLCTALPSRIFSRYYYDRVILCTTPLMQILLSRDTLYETREAQTFLY